MSLNKVQLIGRLGKDPETHTFDSGSQKVSFPIATTERWKDRSTGERREKTEWHNIVVMRAGLTTIAQNYLAKGRQVYIEGRLQTRSWDDQSTGQKRYMTEIMADNIVMLGGKEDNAGGGGNFQQNQQPQAQVNQQQQQQNVQAPPPPAPINTDMPEDDLPF